MTFRHKQPKQTPPKRIHAYVATPAYDGRVLTDYALSLAESCQAATIHGIIVTCAVAGNGAFIDLARNNFVRMFLENPDYTHLFFIDADLKFEPRAFVGLLQSGKPVVAGMYRRRQEPEDYPVRWIEHPELGGLWLEDNWLLCNRVPTGFLCIERSVVETMAEEAIKIVQHNNPELPRLFYTKLTENNSYMGEDFAWCDDYCKRFDAPIYVWPDFDFVHGGYKCNFYNWLSAQAEAAEKGEKQLLVDADGGVHSVDVVKDTSEAA